MLPSFYFDKVLTLLLAFGFFNAYGNPVRKDSVDYVVHLGDYIYEYGNGHYGWGNAYDRIPLPDRDIYTYVNHIENLEPCLANRTTNFQAI